MLCSPFTGLLSDPSCNNHFPILTPNLSQTKKGAAGNEGTWWTIPDLLQGFTVYGVVPTNWHSPWANVNGQNSGTCSVSLRGCTLCQEGVKSDYKMLWGSMVKYSWQLVHRVAPTGWHPLWDNICGPSTDVCLVTSPNSFLLLWLLSALLKMKNRCLSPFTSSATVKD